MNINGECRTVIANKPENFAKLFNLTYYKTTNNKNIYCANNSLKFRLMAGECVKEFSFINNNKKFDLVDLTPNINGIELIVNNNLDGTLSFYVRHSCFYAAVIMQVTYCEGLGFIDFIDLDTFDTKKDSLSNIECKINTIYDLSFVYQNNWNDLKSSRNTIIKRAGDMVSIDLAITGGSDLKAGSIILKLGQSAIPTIIKFGTAFCYDGVNTSISYIYINTEGELCAYATLPTNKQITGTIIYTL